MISPATPADLRTRIAVRSVGTSGTTTLGPLASLANSTTTRTLTLTGSPSGDYALAFYYLDDTKPDPTGGEKTFVITITVGADSFRATLKMTI